MKAAKILGGLGLFLVHLAFLTAPARADFITVPLTTPPANADIRTFSDGTFYPVAPTTLAVGGVPFALTPLDTIPNSLAAAQTFGPGGPIIDIKTNIFGATQVYTLINSAFGEAPFTVGTVEFKGANGSDVTFNLTEGVNIRDHFFNVFNNTVTDPTIVTASFGPGGFQDEVRLDRQTFDLPASFATDTLTDIILSPTADTGFPNGEPFVAGVTVNQAVPEPSTLVLFLCAGVAGAGYVCCRRQKRSRSSKS
jgi:hypothetical protein